MARFAGPEKPRSQRLGSGLIFRFRIGTQNRVRRRQPAKWAAMRQRRTAATRLNLQMVPRWFPRGWGVQLSAPRGSGAAPHQFCQNKFAVALDLGLMRTITSSCPGGGAVAITLPAPSTSCRTGKVNSSHVDEPSFVTVKSVALTCGGESPVDVTSARNELELHGGRAATASGRLPDRARGPLAGPVLKVPASSRRSSLPRRPRLRRRQPSRPRRLLSLSHFPEEEVGIGRTWAWCVLRRRQAWRDPHRYVPGAPCHSDAPWPFVTETICW